MCGACYVDAAVKDSIIAYNAEFQKVSKSPFGSDDQIGIDLRPENWSRMNERVRLI
jgi:hypothetical protein